MTPADQTTLHYPKDGANLLDYKILHRGEFINDGSEVGEYGWSPGSMARQVLFPDT